MIAVNAHPAVMQTFTPTGAITGTPFAVPARTRQSGLQLVISFAADPGASQYDVLGSLDNVNWVAIDSLNFVDDTPQNLEIDPCGFAFIRVDQASKTNAVVTSVTVVLV